MAAANLPPTWTELIPLLYISFLMWLSIFLLSVIRSELYFYFRSSSFRKLVKRAKERGRTNGPILRLAKAFRYFTVRLERNRLPEADVAIYFGYPRCISGFIICFCYMVCTYTQRIPVVLVIFQIVYGIVIAVNLVVHFGYAERPILFALSLTTIVDCLSIPSLICSFRNIWLSFSFLQAYSVLVEWTLLEKHDIVLQNHSALMRLCYNMFIQIACFLYVTSCGVQFFELLGELPVEALRSETYQITWANAVYFAVVTFMTVGYGDFSPYTFLGRMWVVSHIILAAVLVSRGISQLIDALQSMRRGSGSYISSPSSKHVVVTGRVKWEFLRQFVIEFLEEPSNLDTRLIVLASNPDWTEDEWNHFVDQKPLFNHHLVYLEGSVLNFDDLHRAHVHSSQAVFVLADPHREDPYKEDSDILKSVLTIRNYSGTVPIYTLNILNDSSFQFGIALEHLNPESDMNPNVSTALTSVQASSAYLGLVSSPPPPRKDGENLGVIDENIYLQTEDLPRASPIPDGQSTRHRNRSSLPDRSIDLFSAHGAESSVDLSERQNDLRRGSVKAKNRESISLCMQEIETVLLSESIFCNGLSTLIANATLRVAPQSHSKDRPWLMEYKLGAECSVQQFGIRKEMDRMTVADIGTILLDYGLVILAVRENGEIDWTIATTEVILRHTMIAMALSYHDQSVISRIADHAAAYISEYNKIRSTVDINMSGDECSVDDDTDIFGGSGPANRMTHDAGSNNLPQENDSSIDEHRVVASSSAAMTKSPSGSSLLHTRRRSRIRETAERSTPDITPPALSRSRTTSSKSRRNYDDETTDRDGTSDVALSNPTSAGSASEGQPRSRRIREKSQQKPKSTQRIYSMVDRLPAALRGHVIICVEGETSLMNLDVLVRRIWIRRTGQRRRAPIVVINPRFPKNFARRLGGDQSGLFLLQGNSLALGTLKQAQYQSARAFLIMASETKDESAQGSTDSKTIFTVMALDSLLAGRNTFVCCVLDAEASLQLLRAPREARRVGGLFDQGREPELFQMDGSPRTSLSLRSTSMNALRIQPHMGSMRNLSRLGAIGNPARTFQTSFPASRSSGLRARGMTRSSSIRGDQLVETSDEDDDDEYGTLTGLSGTRLHDSEFSERRAREERYERQRYASGEMIISSLFTSLLAREYTDPGYIRLIRQLIGASSGSRGSWIRQVSIPDSWTSVEKAIDGRNYRELSLKLLEYRCVALGLYRSGDAPVRKELKSELWLRRTDEFDYFSDRDDDSLGRSPVQFASRSLERDLMSGNHLLDYSLENNRMPSQFPEGLPLLTEDEFDQMTYTCPSTQRRIYFQESENGENVLPYVYSCPEPYTAVVSNDLVYVLCDPSTKIPAEWDD